MSGMSEIAIGKKEKVSAEEPACATVEEDELEDIDIIDI